MTDFLIHLAALSLGGALATLILLATSRLTRTRSAARWRCLAWLLLCLRLVIPFPLFPQQSSQPAPIQLTVPSMEQPLLPPSSPSPSPSPAPQQPPSAGSTSASALPPVQPSQPSASAPSFLDSLSLSHLFFAVWLLGAASVLVWGAISHLRFLRYLRRWSTPVRSPDILSQYNALGDRLRLNRRPALLVCPGLSVPMLAGLLRPVLLLPQPPCPGRELEYALLHELTHFRRHDIWLKALSLVAAAIHWFNPILWLMRRGVERDTELSCDEATLALLPPEEHAAYGQTILNAVYQRKAP